ncbi:hypothetical protein KAW38_02090 [Candidatus Micrarchaeota archaeon]|nr:hypothetical protein [Candidatus Micrarchaeota archaeon]
MKRAVLALLIVLAVVAVYFILFLGEQHVPPAGDLDEIVIKGLPAPIENFTTNLENSNVIYIVMDLKSEDPVVRNNIMQCGIDLSASVSTGFYEKKVFALEDDACTRKDGIVSVQECIEEINQGEGVIFWIKEGETLVFEKTIVVGISEYYQPGGCSIDKSDQEEVFYPEDNNTASTPLNETNSTIN